VLKIDYYIRIPDSSLQLLARDDFAGALQKNREDSEGLALELYASAGSPQLTRFQVRFKETEGQAVGSLYIKNHVGTAIREPAHSTDR
jgi:hypothetical protein